MLSRDTLLEVTKIIENYTEAELDRMFIYFDISLVGKRSKPHQANEFFNHMLAKGKKIEQNGEHFHLNILNFILDKYYEKKAVVYKSSDFFDSSGFQDEVEPDPFNLKYQRLLNSLSRDGYTIKDKEVVKKLPDNLALPAQKDELSKLLEEFKFETAKEHLRQAISNHTTGKWAAANAQFRTFLESILIDIARILLPNNPVRDPLKAIKLLTNSLQPPFFRGDLNEIETNSNKYPYPMGLWKRLHPEGSHKGLSYEEDCTFRYHTTLIFVRYLLKRLKQRNND